MNPAWSPLLYGVARGAAGPRGRPGCQDEDTLRLTVEEAGHTRGIMKVFIVCLLFPALLSVHLAEAKAVEEGSGQYNKLR